MKKAVVVLSPDFALLICAIIRAKKFPESETREGNLEKCGR